MCSRMIGTSAEFRSLEYLNNKGLILLHRNFYSRFGEIDLIMQDKQDIVFVEVKMRSSRYANVAYSITPSKQKKLILTAKYYIFKNCSQEPNCRFDAVLLVGFNQIIWLKNIISVIY
jgi:putative endonuclease